MAKGDDIEDRLINFAVRIVKLSDHLPKTLAGRHIAGQLLRSGTSPAAHYAEARGAESTNDFCPQTQNLFERTQRVKDLAQNHCQK